MNIQKILILGAGRMGAWFVDSLCLDYDVAVYDVEKAKLRYLFNCQRFTGLDEIKGFEPDMVINAVNLQLTIQVFNEILPYLPSDCLLSDITSVKTPLREFYLNSNRRFVSTHPMFGPTFANIKDLSDQNAIIIQQSDEEGKKFFRNFYKQFNIQVFEYTFIEHDKTIAYSLSVPFASSMVFASNMKHQEAPGTTFKKHYKIAKGVLSEDDFLLSEILFSPYTLEQIEGISHKLEELKAIVKEKNTEKMRGFLMQLRENIKELPQ